MTTNYPSGLDSFGAITTETMATPVGGRSHKAMHNDANAAIVAVQTELGTNPRGTAATVAARLDTVQAYRAVTSTDSVAVTDHVVHATSGTFTLTLPTAVGIAGREFVIRNSGTGTITLGRTSSQTIDGVAANLVIAGKGFVEVVSDGAGWQVLRGTYTDESVGRRIFTWDSVNGRWQQTYGDTGWRDITSLLDGANWTCTSVMLRRQNDVVEIAFNNLTGTGTTSQVPIGSTLPSGFRPKSTEDQLYNEGTIAAPTMAAFRCASSTVYVHWTATAGYPSMTYITGDAWPTVLPGTADGSIPA